jgi:hypothetical protein
MDADGESIGVDMVFIEKVGHRWDLLVRNQKIDRASVAPGHSMADPPTEVPDLTLTHERGYTMG